MKYTIEEVRTQDTWQNKYGKDMRTYALKLEGVDSWVKLNQLVTTDPPVSGQVLQGDLTERSTPGGKQYYQFKKDFSGFDKGESRPKQSSGDNGQLDRIEQMVKRILSTLEDSKDMDTIADEELVSDEEMSDDPFSDL